MAKKKLTLEDMLVPVDEIPYEVPENWCWTRLKFIIDKINYGYTESASMDNIGPKFLRITDIKENGVDWNSVPYCIIDEKNYEKYKLNKGDIVVARTGATTGKNHIIEEEIDAVFASYLIRFTLNKDINRKYISYFMKTQDYWNQIMEERKGIAQPGVNAQKLSNIIIPLPPLAEQERIVNRIESLFDKVDRVAELVDEARDGFEKRRAAILERAFSGELTKCDSINDNEIDLSILSKDIVEFDIPCEIPSNWKWLKFNECCTFLGSGVTPKGGSSVYSEKGTPFIRSQNVLKGSLDMSDVVYISDEIQEKMKRTTVYSKDTLLNITGASIGRCAYVPDDIEEANVNQHVCILRFKEYIDYKYPSYWINSPIFQNIINKEQIGATRQALNFKQLRGMWIPVPPIDEQRKIVDILDRLMEKEKEISELSDMDCNIESIKKSILAKAFRGELGSNDLNEESSIELIKDMLNS